MPDTSCTTTLRDAAEEFLAQKTIAVAGVSRDTKQPANLIDRRLREQHVFAVNPTTDMAEGDRYPTSARCPRRSTAS